MTDVATTHAEGCWAWGPKHHACAVREIERLRASVAEMERDLDACRVDHAEAYEQGRQDALRGVQAACLFEMGKLELIPMEYRGASWDWEGYPEEMRMHEAFDRVAQAAAMKLCSVCAEREIDYERDDEGRDLCRPCLGSWWDYCSNFVTGSYQRWVKDRLETLRRQRALRAAEEAAR